MKRFTVKKHTLRSRFYRGVSWLVTIGILGVYLPPVGAMDAHAAAQQETRKEKKQPHAVAPASELRVLSSAEMSKLCGKGSLRKPELAGQHPWWEYFKDVNVAEGGNLLKAYSDVSIPAAYGPGIELTRTYNSMCNEVGPWGIGWSHSYDTWIGDSTALKSDEILYQALSEAPPNEVVRKNASGTLTFMERNADGTYTQPPYDHNIYTSTYQTVTNADGNMISIPTEDKMITKDGTVYYYAIGTSDPANADGRRRLTRIQDRNGNSLNFTYTNHTDAEGKIHSYLTQITDAPGHIVTFTWLPDWSRLASITWGEGTTQRIYQYEYDSNGNLWHAVTPAGRTTAFTYTTYQDPMTQATEEGLIASITDPGGHEISYVYGNLTCDNPTCVFGIGADGNQGNYDGWLDGIGVARIFEESLGQTHFHHEVDNTVYSEIHRVCVRFSMDDPNTVPVGGGWSFCEDASGISKTTNSAMPPGGNWVQHPMDQGWHWDQAGNLCSIDRCPTDKTDTTDWSVKNISYDSIYDAQGCLVDPGWGDELSETDYHVQGVPGHTTYYQYEPNYHQITKVIDPLGHITDLVYDNTVDPHDPNWTPVGNKSNLRRVYDARYGQTQKRTEYTYNTKGQVLSMLDMNGGQTLYEYDTNEDAYGNVTAVVNPLGKRTEYRHDNIGQVIWTRDPKLQTTVTAYNADGQSLREDYSNGTSTVTTYNAEGLPETVTDQIGTISYVYGANHQPTQVTDQAGRVITYSYNYRGDRIARSNGGITTHYYPSNEIYQSDKAYPYQRMIRGDNWFQNWVLNLYVAEDNQGNETCEWMDDHGRLVATFSNVQHGVKNGYDWIISGYYERYYYNENGQIKEISVQRIEDGSAGRSLQRIQYTYDDTGNRITRTQNYYDTDGNATGQRTEQYGYDELNRLTGVNYGDGHTQGFAYDPMSNRLGVMQDGLTAQTCTYGAANLLQTFNGQSYTYDDNGNTLTGNERSYTWDIQDRMTSCTVGGNTSSYTYRADGMRLTKTAGGVTTEYLYDGQQPLTELKSDGTRTDYLFSFNGQPMGRTVTANGQSNTQFYLYDGLGSVTAIGDVNYNIIQTMEYDVWGSQRVGQGNTTNTLKYVGSLGHHSDDESGLIYMRARYYDPNTGRFLSEDPGQNDNNWYIYAGDDPINYMDQNGEKRQTIQLSGGYWIAIDSPSPGSGGRPDVHFGHGKTTIGAFYKDGTWRHKPKKSMRKVPKPVAKYLDKKEWKIPGGAGSCAMDSVTSSFQQNPEETVDMLTNGEIQL